MLVKPSIDLVTIPNYNCSYMAIIKRKRKGKTQPPCTTALERKSVFAQLITGFCS